MITGEKVIIKGLTAECAKNIYEWVNREDLRPLTGTVYPVSEFEHEEWIKKTATRTDMKLFLVCDRETGVDIGTVGLKNFDYISRNAELFISLGNDSVTEKGGYGTDTVRTFVKFCFESLNLHRVYLHVFESNKRAVRCYEKAGMKCEGVLCEHHYQNGKYENVLVMGIVSPL